MLGGESLPISVWTRRLLPQLRTAHLGRSVALICRQGPKQLTSAGLPPREVAGMQEPEICYILDGILFLYGIVLTTLYCHLKVKTARAKKAAAAMGLYEHLKSPDKQIYSEIGKGETEMALKGAEGIYTGLGPTEKATYETLHCLEKKNSPSDA